MPRLGTRHNQDPVVWRLSTVDYRHDIAYTGEIDEQQLPLSAS
jgi:hypothetical protein